MKSQRFADPTVDLEAALRFRLEQIPPGFVTTYGDLAQSLGDLRVCRWVGHFMMHHEHSRSPLCTCHRVVRADGQLGRFVTGEPRDKRELLEMEGRAVVHSRVDLSRDRRTSFDDEPPLVRLSELQRRLAQERGHTEPDLIGRVAGVDVSYRGHEGVAA